MTTPSSIRKLLPRLAIALLVIALIPALDPTGASSVRGQTMSSEQLNNLISFTKLYGYVRFFHPSDEAAGADWDRLAIYGCDRMLGAHDREEVKTALTEIFGPIAPTIRIYDAGTVAGKDSATFVPRDTARFRRVAWQHLGVGLNPRSVYSSIRLNRKTVGAGGNAYGFGTVTSRIEPSALRGKRIMLRAAVKSGR